MLVLVSVGALIGISMQLEHGLGPALELFSQQAYNHAFTAHGAVMIVALRLGVFVPVANLHVAALHERTGKPEGPSRWLAGVALLAYLGGVLGMMVMLAVSQRPEWLATATGALSLGDLSMGLAIIVGMVGQPWRSSSDSLLGWTVMLAASVQMLVGVTNSLAWLSDGGVHAGGLLHAQTVMAVGLALAVQRGADEQPLRPLVLGGLISLALYGALLDGAEALPGLQRLLGTAIHVAVLAALFTGSRKRDEPAADYLPAFVLVYMISLGVQAYLGTLQVDVHVQDTYFVVGDFHLATLLVVAIAGPMALRHFARSRFGDPPAWARKLAPTMIGVAVAWFGISLLVLGHGGMPRRYYAYLPEFILGHRSATVAALLLAIGVGLEGWLWLRRFKLRSRVRNS